MKADKKIAKKLLKVEQNIDKPKKLKVAASALSRPASTQEKRPTKSALKNPSMKFVQEQGRPLSLDIPPLKPRVQNNDFFTRITTKENFA